MRDVDDAHDAEHQRQAERGQRQHRRGDEAFERGEEEMRAEGHGAYAPRRGRGSDFALPARLRLRGEWSRAHSQRQARLSDFARANHPLARPSRQGG